MYGHLSANALPPEYPQFYERGEGARVWDVDGNEYVDFMCSFGPVLLGHNHPEGRGRRRRAARRRATPCPAPARRWSRRPKLLTGRVAHADWAMFAKNGTDATTIALMVARAATGRPKVLAAKGAYHGAAPMVHPPRRRRHRRGPGQPALLHVQRPGERRAGARRRRARGRRRHHRLALPARRGLRPGAGRRRVRPRAARAVRPDRRGFDHG